MDEKRRSYLLKLARGKDFRRALHAIAELRASKDAAAAAALAPPAPGDEQRAFQYRVARTVLGDGMAALVKAWPTLGDEKWRAQLVSEIGQFLDRWADPALIELALAALEDAGREVWIKAVWMLQFVREPPAGEKRSRWSRTAQSCAAAADTLRAAITPAQRARMTRALIAILARHAQDPHPVLAQAVEVLGYTANKHDTTAIEQLEALHAGAGEPHTVSYKRAAKEDFTWYERLALARKGDDPQEMVRIKYTPTGLLDRKLVEATLARIRRRDP